MTIRCMGLIAVALAFIGNAVAIPPNETDQFVEHLQFLGYKTSMSNDEKFLLAKHPDHVANIVMEQFRGGVLLSAVFALTEEGQLPSSRPALLEVTNSLTKAAGVSRFYVDSESVMIEAWFQAPHDRERFGKFLQQWHKDTDDLLLSRSDDIKRFLK